MARYHVRRTDRELTEPDAVASVLRRGRFVSVAVVHDGEPYVFTLSYGFDEAKNALYSHVAREGRKLDAIAADPRVCATVIVDGGYEQGACKHHYESVVITGRMQMVSDAEEIRHGMRVLIQHLEDDAEAAWERNGLDGDKVFERLGVLRLDIEEITGKAGS